jgi:hypothetical protein
MEHVPNPDAEHADPMLGGTADGRSLVAEVRHRRAVARMRAAEEQQWIDEGRAIRRQEG